jgi:hypothetical protein
MPKQTKPETPRMTLMRVYTRNIITQNLPAAYHKGDWEFEVNFRNPDQHLLLRVWGNRDFNRSYAPMKYTLENDEDKMMKLIMMDIEKGL